MKRLSKKIMRSQSTAGVASSAISANICGMLHHVVPLKAYSLRWGSETRRVDDRNNNSDNPLYDLFSSETRVFGTRARQKKQKSMW